MKKNIKLTVILFIGLYCMSACSNHTETIIDSPTVSIADNEDTTVKIPDGFEIISDRNLFQEVHENQEYNFKTDHQFYIPNNYETAESEDAYYFLDYFMLYTWDKTSKEYRPLCGKPDCQHKADEGECNALVGRAEGLHYYEGSLYTVVAESEESSESITLQRISADGTEKKNICKIATCYIDKEKAYDDNVFTVRGIIHRGYLYYTYNFGTGSGLIDTAYYNNNSNILYRIKLDGTEEAECIMPLKKGGNTAQLHFKAAGSYIYFVDSDWQAQGKLYRINTESKIIEEMGIGEIPAFDYQVADGTIVYKKEYDDNQFLIYNPETGEESVFTEMEEISGYECWDMEYDGKYFFVYYVRKDNDLNWIRVVIDKNGNKVTQFSLYDSEDTPEYFTKAYNGFSDYFLCSIGLENETFYYLDKSLLEKGEANLIEVEK